jgi:hypothetical protein
MLTPQNKNNMLLGSLEHVKLMPIKFFTKMSNLTKRLYQIYSPNFLN